MKSIRTNNDVEGWNLGLNRRASGKSLRRVFSHRELKWAVWRWPSGEEGGIRAV